MVANESTSRSDVGRSRAPKRIVFSLWGSLGDLHPYLPIALALQSRGHQCLIATSALYEEKCRALGLGFHAVRPDLPSLAAHDELQQLCRELMDPKQGTANMLQKYLLPNIAGSFADLYAATGDADLLVTHPLPLVGPLVAAVRHLPWISTVLAPMSLFSAYDPPLGTVLPWVGQCARWHPWLGRMFIAALIKGTDQWMAPVYSLREALGLPRGLHPLFAGQHSPHNVLALFSRILAVPQPDWPENLTVTGFPFYDHRGLPGDTHELPPGLAEFLASGAPPLVFTLGSAAVWNAGDFFHESVKISRHLGLRAVLLAGPAASKDATIPSDADVFVVDYAPFGKLFERSLAVVHQGGIGTTGQVLRAGVPALVTAFAHDQFDNGARLQRLGIGAVIPRARYTCAKVLPQLRKLLLPETRSSAAAVALKVRSEQGAQCAADILERTAQTTDRWHA